MSKKNNAAASSAGAGGAGHIAVIAGIVGALLLFTYTGGGAAQKKWVPVQGTVTEAYTLAEATDTQAAGSYAVVSFTDGSGTAREETTLPLETALDGHTGEMVDIEYRSNGDVRIAGNYVETKDNTARNLILSMVAVIGVYFLSEIIKKIIPPEMVYEKLRGKKKN